MVNEADESSALNFPQLEMNHTGIAQYPPAVWVARNTTIARVAVWYVTGRAWMHRGHKWTSAMWLRASKSQGRLGGWLGCRRGAPSMWLARVVGAQVPGVVQGECE